MAAWGFVFWVDGGIAKVLAWLDDQHLEWIDFGPSAFWRKPVIHRIAAWQTELFLQYSEFLAVAPTLVLGFRDGEKAGDV